MIKYLSNRNLKKLLKKKVFTPEVIMEFKTSFFITPSKLLDDGYCEFEYFKYNDGEILYLFTSKEEYLEMFNDNYELAPVMVSIGDLDDFLFSDTKGVILNPCSDDLFISINLINHLLIDINTNNYYMSSWAIDEYDSDNSLLLKYCEGKKSFKLIPNLFDYLDASCLYTIIKTPLELTEDDPISLKNKEYNFYKKDSYYLFFTDKKMISEEIRNLDGYFYYCVADVIDIVQLILQYDFKGFILKTPENDFIVKREQLLKNFDKISYNYHPRKNARKYAYKINDRGSD